MQFKRKLKNKTGENGKRNKFWASFWPILAPKIFCYKLSLHAISRKTNEWNLKKGKKTSFGADFGTLGSNVGPQKIFYGFYVN